MSRCVIIGGASIKDYPVVKGYLRPDDWIVCCDSGLKHREGLGVKADLVVGDFDSHPQPSDPELEIIRLPCEKDDTDTMFAAHEAVKRGYKDILLLGVLGDRMDHSLCNIYLLLWLFGHGCHALAVDDLSEMEIIGPGRPGLVADSFPFFSLLNISGCAKGISITGAKYPLEGYELLPDYQLAVSNEPLPGETARISLEEGSLLLIRDRS